MIKSLLIANRGEIACRVIRTARRMGIRTIAVYSDADRHALHVKSADEAVHIGPAPAAESYLIGEKVIAAAKETGAEAIHPGYGFLSENAAFAEAVVKAGLIWVGPNASSIEAMGLKDAAKSLMQEAGVPTTPGYLGDDQSLKRLKAEADAIGYPVLIKAVAGGGGKGMRKVDSAADFKDALASCQREAKASFGNDLVLLEKWITNPRHIEVQVFGDTHGNIVHLFERDCTLQRRHQKVIEEAPAPGMDEATRAAICAAAVNAAKAVDYVGAGTVEFIADGSGALSADTIWFMEMNTRLQVEHPVTEAITGVDLVEWQLRVASGEPLPRTQDELSICGWAMEARLYAENPETGFLPSIGTLETLSLPAATVRLDTGIETGGKVSSYYDPMIAKLISAGPDRETARVKLADACDRVTTWPVHNNAGFLSRLLREETFIKGTATTGFIGDHLDRLTAKPAASDQGLAKAASALRDAERAMRTPSPSDTPWAALTGFRANAADDLECWVDVDGTPTSVTLTADQAGETHRLRDGVLLIEAGWPFKVTLPQFGTGSSPGAVSDGTIASPMPGRVLAVDVADGDRVSEGQTLVTLEAMKMEHALKAPFAGTVTSLAATVDAQVTEGYVLMKIEPDEA
ncbi:MAG: acetyl/propionyl/methylcrotonyl-CoA carboxylase subunit alpha [Henriciella sp.]|nr:acetyl/propionyl/methylcrotonyl-CoA carboxylase subunit alpha [Henriciella sp.]